MGTHAGRKGMVLASLLLCVTAAASEPGPFPVPAGLEGHVGFWRLIFAEYDLDEVVVHHMDYPGLVYEVFDLPGEIGESYSDEQEMLVEALREDWEKRLGKLADSVEAGAVLSREQQELALRITALAGGGGVAEARRQVRTQRGLRSRFKRGLELSTRYDAAFRKIFREAGLPEDLAALPHVESSFQPHAHSSAGAAGVWQFTRSTGRRFLAINSRLDERYDPIAAAEGAARYMAEAYDKLQSWPLAVTSYNHGVNGMLRARDRFGDEFMRIVHEYRSRFFGFASRNFYAEFLAAREIAADPDAFFPEGLSPEPPMQVDPVFLEEDLYASSIARLYGVPLRDLAAMNPAWTRRTVHGVLTVPSGSRVWLPPGALDRHERGEVPEVDLTPPGLPPDNYHTVARGENLSSIARDYGMTVTGLRRLNGMSPRETRIYAGEKLKVDGLRTRYHTVARGDTLTGIARAYGVHLNDLLRSNRLTLNSVIHPGQRLRIPMG